MTQPPGAAFPERKLLLLLIVLLLEAMALSTSQLRSLRLWHAERVSAADAARAAAAAALAVAERTAAAASAQELAGSAGKRQGGSDLGSGPGSGLEQVESEPEPEQSLPCVCRAENLVEDLGPMYFPRYLHVVRCHEGSCWSPPYRCLQREYAVNVLRRRTDGGRAREDLRLPPELRPGWRFEERTVVVGCECTLEY